MSLMSPWPPPHSPPLLPTWLNDDNNDNVPCPSPLPPPFNDNDNYATINDLDLLKNELWNANFAKKYHKHMKKQITAGTHWDLSLSLSYHLLPLGV